MNQIECCQHALLRACQKHPNRGLDLQMQGNSSSKQENCLQVIIEIPHGRQAGIENSTQYLRQNRVFSISFDEMTK